MAMWRQWGTAKSGVTALIIAGAVFYLLILNGSRVEYLAAYIAGFFWLASRARPFWAVLWVLVPVNALVIWGVPDAIQGSIEARLEIWNAAVSMFFANPFGVGLGGFDHDFFLYYERVPVSHMKPVNYAGAAHNEILDVLCHLGVIGLLLVAWCIWSVWQRHEVALWVLFGLCLIGFPLQNPATALLACCLLAESWRARMRVDGGWPINTSEPLRFSLSGTLPTRLG